MQPMIKVYNAEPMSARIGIAEAAALMGCKATRISKGA